ncbi:MAG: hypothetical protein JZU65_06625 [Chlorobium sp.]|nr:hypothetical protein [Chlorobium sp.]
MPYCRKGKTTGTLLKSLRSRHQQRQLFYCRCRYTKQRCRQGIRYTHLEYQRHYQSLLKMFLKERIDREYEPKRNKPRSSRKANA